MDFPLGAAHAPSLGGWFNPLIPRMVDQDLAPYPILNARNASTTPTTPGDSVNMFIDSTYEDAEYAASIISACGDRTTYAVRCTSVPDDIDQDCGPNGIVSFNSPRNIKEQVLTGTNFYLDYDCNCG